MLSVLRFIILLAAIVVLEKEYVLILPKAVKLISPVAFKEIGNERGAPGGPRVEIAIPLALFNSILLTMLVPGRDVAIDMFPLIELSVRVPVSTIG